MRFSSAVLCALSAAVVSAQSNSTACCSIDPGSVDINTRLSWCRAQKNTCPELCSNGQTSANDCDATQLTYSCTCLKGNTPNVSDYGQTLPSLQCDEWYTQCIASHPNDLAGQTFCKASVCGQKNASANVSPSGSGSGSPSATSGSGSSSTSTSGSGSKPSSAGIVAAGRQYGTSALAVVLLAAFGMAL